MTLPKHITNHLVSNKVPFAVTIELTTKCNWRCLHCFVVNAHNRIKKELSIEDVKKTLDTLYDMGAFFCLFTGGEVALRPDFSELVNYATNKGFALSVYSNASLITDEMAKMLAEAHIVEFQTTILAATPKTHDAITQVKGSHKALWKGIENLLKYKINVFAKTPIIKQNAMEIDEIRKQTAMYGLPYMTSPLIFPRWDGDDEVEAFRVNDEEMVESIKSEIMANSAASKGPDEPPVCNEDSRVEGCKAGVTGISIDADGSISPCQGFPITAGNIYEDDLKEVWLNSDLFRQLRTLQKKLQAMPLDSDDEGFQRICPQLSYFENKTLDVPSKEHERFYKAFKTAQKKLDAEEHANKK